MKRNFLNTNAGLAILLAVSSVFQFACSSVKSGSANKQAKAAITATKAEMNGEGTATFTQKGNEVTLKLDISFPGKAGQNVAVHIHEHGDCGNAGNNTHGHWNPTNSQHGKWGASAYHLGDIGNVSLDGSGKGTLTMSTDRWSIGTGAQNDVVGKGIIVHDGTDDYVTQPTGNAGSRIGCGVIASAQ